MLGDIHRNYNKNTMNLRRSYIANRQRYAVKKGSLY